MTRDEQELVVIDNRGEEELMVYSTDPVWIRRLEKLEAKGLARRIHTIRESDRELGAEWRVDRTVRVGLRPKKVVSEAQRESARRRARAGGFASKPLAKPPSAEKTPSDPTGGPE